MFNNTVEFYRAPIALEGNEAWLVYKRIFKPIGNTLSRKKFFATIVSCIKLQIK